MHTDKYVPADNNGGWGVAAGIIVLALLFISAATYIHKRTYKPPTDVTAQVHGSRHVAGTEP